MRRPSHLGRSGPDVPVRSKNPRLLLTVVCRYSHPAVSFTPEKRYLRTLRVSGPAAKKNTGPASGRGARARQPEGVSHETT